MLRRFSVYSKVVKNARPEPPKAEILMQSSSVVVVKDETIKCCGNGVVGHPVIFINLVITRIYTM